MTAHLHLIHSRPLPVTKLNQHEKSSIATRALVFGTSRFTIAREYGIQRWQVDDICDAAMFERGRRVGHNEARFNPPMGRTA
ncbi:MAG: hypothetical protein ABFD89_22205 [Bryobacteraceae bacterium]